MSVHGAGLDSTSFRPLGTEFDRRRLSHTEVQRRGYDRRRPTADLETHVADVLELLDGLDDDRVVYVGVSGGATIGARLSEIGHPKLTAFVLHEPLVGSSAGRQHDIVRTAVERLAFDERPGAVDDFLTALVGDDHWHRLPEAVRAAALGHECAVRTEVGGFVAFELGDPPNHPRSTPVVWSVGEQSPRWRHDAAAIGAARGWEIRTLPCRHTPQAEAPGAFAELIAAQVAA